MIRLFAIENFIKDNNKYFSTGMTHYTLLQKSDKE